MAYRLRSIRRAKDITQEQLSARSGVSRATIAAIESGKKRVVLSSTILKLANALNCRVEDLFFDQEV